MSRFVLLAFFALLCIVPSFAHEGHSHDHEEAAEEEPSDVLTLDSNNFDATIALHDLILVEFYAPWCGHCKKLAPEYEVAATQLKESGISIAKVDADQADNKPLAQRFGVRGFPTLKVFRNGSPVDYKGERNAAGIVSYMKKQALPTISHLSTQAEAEAFSTSDKVVIIGFFADQDSSEYATFKTTADALRDDSPFADVIGQPDVEKHFGVKAPSVVLFKKFDEGKNVLSENFDTLTTFINTHKVPLIDEIGPENYKNYAESGLPLAYLFVDLTVAGQQEEFVAHITDIAKESKGKLNFVYIDWAKFAKHSERLGLSGKTVPAFAIEDNTKGTHYAFDENTPITAEAIKPFITSFLSGELAPTIKSEDIPEPNDGPVTVVVAKNYDQIVLDANKDVLVEFYAPWCGHCKQLAPIYEKLGEAFKDEHSIVIAKMDATANDIDPNLGVRGFPTLKFFPAKSKAVPLEYNGDRSYDDLLTFVKKHASVPVNVEGGKDEL